MKTILVTLAFALLSPLSALACDGGDEHSAKTEPTAEERTQMATMHTKMAECLASTKPMADCHKEMASSCTMGKDGKCPMTAMNHGHSHKGKGKSHGKKSTKSE